MTEDLRTKLDELTNLKIGAICQRIRVEEWMDNPPEKRLQRIERGMMVLATLDRADASMNRTWNLYLEPGTE